jgi:hypothetical protein
MLTPVEVQRGPAATRRAGLVVLLGAALSVALHAWLARGAFVPIAGNADIDYVFVSATGRTFVGIVLIAGALVCVAHLLVRRFVTPRDVPPALFSNEDAAYARPLFCFAASLLPLLNLVRPLARFLPVVSYVIVDLRWWWTALVAAWVIRNLDARVNGAGRRWIAGLQPPLIVRRWAPYVSLAAIAVTWSVAGTPILRDLGDTIGDEPKYVRYCENWYQGLGFEISQIKPMAELPEGFRPRVWRNVVLLAETLPRDLRGLAADAAEYVRNPSHSFNRAVHREGGFLDGKDGGMYQVHNPGLSFLMFPAYYVDRRFAPIEPGSPAQWPRHLPTVNAFFVAVYAAWTLLVFEFLRRCGATTPTAWIASLTSTLTLPAAAFPFQYYPELIAGLFVSFVCSHLLFGDADRPRRSFFFGLLAGYLPWLHVRFTVVMVALAVGTLVLWRGQWRRVLLFMIAIAIPAVLYSLYAYRITGSAMPSAMWSAEGSGDNFVIMGMIKNSVAYLIDREWGLFAHSPVFLLALPGYWWLARRKPDVAFLCTMVFLALLLPAAGKTLVQTTPMRLIVAVVPIGATPIIELLDRRGRAMLIAFGLLLVVSLDNALAYNLHHYRHFDTLVDWSFSGWRVNLLFPGESRRPWTISAANGILLVLWLGAIVALLIAPAVLHWRRPRVGERPPVAVHRRPIVAPAFAAVALFVALGTVVSATTGAWTRRRYLIPPTEAAQQAASLIDTLGQCTLCLASHGGQIGTRRMLATLEAVDPLVAMRQRGTVVDERGYKEWLAMPGLIRAWYTEATGHEPGNEDLGHYMYQWREDHVQPAEIRRRIFASAGKGSEP